MFLVFVRLFVFVVSTGRVEGAEVSSECTRMCEHLVCLVVNIGRLRNVGRRV